MWQQANARPSGTRVVIAILVLAPTILLSGCGDEPIAEPEIIRPVRAIKVSDPAQMVGRQFPGQAKPTQEIELSFRVAGPLISRPVDVGSAVKKGDVVARIDARDFEVSLRNAQGQLDQAKAVLTRAEADYQRLQNVYRKDPGATSEAAIDRARQARDSEAANINSLAASVAAAKDQLGYTYLKAPFDGTVVKIYVENFEDVRAKQPVMRIVDDSRVEMIINIPENLISYVPDVTNIRVTFDPFPEHPIPAEVKEIGSEASKSTRTYPVTVIMDQPDDFKILPGMAGKASGDPPADFRPTAAEVPVSAVFSREGTPQSYVWVIDEATMTVHQREVTVGELTDHGVQIKAGLEPGEWIATAGVFYLLEGRQVRILDDSAGE